MNIFKTIKKRGQVLRLRLPRHRQTPNHLKRVNAHAFGVNFSLLSLMISNFGEFG